MTLVITENTIVNNRQYLNVINLMLDWSDTITILVIALEKLLCI